jgi:hypothetical protein
VSSPLRKIFQIGKDSKVKCRNTTYTIMCIMLNLCLVAIFQNVKNIQVRTNCIHCLCRNCLSIMVWIFFSFWIIPNFSLFAGPSVRA